MESPNYYLREVREEDCALLLSWANDEAVRGASINSEEILVEEHANWFKSILSSEKWVFYLLEVNNQEAGQIRFIHNSEENVWEIGYSIAKEFRGMGLSKTLVQLGIEKLNRFPVVAYVKPQNIRSVLVFERLCFTSEGRVTIKNIELLKFKIDVRNW